MHEQTRGGQGFQNGICLAATIFSSCHTHAIYTQLRCKVHSFLSIFTDWDICSLSRSPPSKVRIFYLFLDLYLSSVYVRCFFIFLSDSFFLHCQTSLYILSSFSYWITKWFSVDLYFIFFQLLVVCQCLFLVTAYF